MNILPVCTQIIPNVPSYAIYMYMAQYTVSIHVLHIRSDLQGVYVYIDWLKEFYTCLHAYLVYTVVPEYRLSI